MPLAKSASITSPEQGAQHECNNNLSPPLGNSKIGRSIGVTSGVFIIFNIYLLFCCLGKNEFHFELMMTFGFAIQLVNSTAIGTFNLAI